MMTANPLKYALCQMDDQPVKSLTHSGWKELSNCDCLSCTVKVRMQRREGTKEITQAAVTRREGGQGTARGLVMARCLSRVMAASM